MGVFCGARRDPAATHLRPPSASRPRCASRPRPRCRWSRSRSTSRSRAAGSRPRSSAWSLYVAARAPARAGRRAARRRRAGCAVALQRAYGAELSPRRLRRRAAHATQGRALLVVVLALRAWPRRVLRRWRCGRPPARAHAHAAASTRAACCAAPASPVLAVARGRQPRRSTCPSASPTQRARSPSGNASTWRRRPAHAARRRRRQRAPRRTGASRWTASQHEPAARRRARARTGSRGSASGPSPPLAVRRALALPRDARPSSAWPGLVLLVVALAVPLGVAVARLRGPERHAARGVPRGRARAAGSTPASTGTGRCRRCSSGSSAPAGVVLRRAGDGAGASAPPRPAARACVAGLALPAAGADAG